MEGAFNFSTLFSKPEQIGRLYVLPGSHARGKTFHIYLLPEGEKAEVHYISNPPVNEGTLEVYGVKGGHTGWTEYYGWLHQGKWQEDFQAVYENRIKADKTQ